MRKSREELARDQQGGTGGNPYEEQMTTEEIAPSPPMAPPITRGPNRVLDPIKDEIAPKPRCWVVVDVPRGRDGQYGSISIGRFKTTIQPGKVLDERYFDVRAIQMQGVKLEEVKTEPAI